ncbi:DUF305 domain-containing protein [Gordonia sp. (in: high G+C Gram-positive bacteria)]|uniref:DUF305 domain-containing protein n=1 Tax=Gordonia sp. (in: high G+C Gram-positive bacteria) TaxID=84139 RepID=UPI003C79414D
MRTRPVVTAIVAVAVAVGVAACSPNEEPSDMPHDMSTMSTPHHMPSASAPATGEHNAADTMFAQMMLPHHEQALVMSDIILGKSDIPQQVTDIAKQIKDAQGPEIAQLKEWLTTWGEPVSVPMDHEMDGMLSEAELQQLREAQGNAAAKLFLEQMIEHHEGAVDMAEDEIEDGKNADSIAMARSIVESQQKEIDTMKEMLKGL